MMRTRSLIAALLLAGGVTLAALPAGATPAGASAAGPAGATACAGVLQITHLAFKPPAVFPGQSSTVHLTARNCTNKTVHASLTWLARFMGPTPGLPPGCPAIDPIAVGADFAPLGQFASKLTYLVPGGCTATSLQATARLSVGAAVVAQQSANLTITRPA